MVLGLWSQRKTNDKEAKEKRRSLNLTKEDEEKEEDSVKGNGAHCIVCLLVSSIVSVTLR